jgi:MFS family permease
LAAAFYFIGGGPVVAFAIGTTMISDIAPEEKRTSIFLYLTASVLITETIAPILSVRLMESGDWIPLVLSIVIQLVGTLVAVLFPETLHLRDIQESGSNPTESLELQTKVNDSWLKKLLRHFQSVYYFLKCDWTLGMVILTFMANRLGGQVTILLLRYASKRYSWTIKESAYLMSFRAATNLVAIVVCIPLVNFLLLRYMRLPSYSVDLWIARGSIILTAISFLIIGLAAHPPLLILGLLVHNLGTGFSAAMRSVSIHIIGGQPSSNIAKLMSTIAIVESLGAMVAGPLLNQIFQWGMELGSAWLGLPFLVVVFVFIGISAITFVVDVNDVTAKYSKIPSEDEDQVEEEQEGAPTLARDYVST